jgi:hypothetical protein
MAACAYPLKGAPPLPHLPGVGLATWQAGGGRPVNRRLFHRYMYCSVCLSLDGLDSLTARLRLGTRE